MITFALITFVSAGVRTALDARDMFSKLCVAGLTAFIGFQALVIALQAYIFVTLTAVYVSESIAEEH